MVLYQRKPRMEARGLADLSRVSGGKRNQKSDLGNNSSSAITSEFEVDKMSDKEKIAMVIGMLDISKALCMRKGTIDDAEKVCGMLQTTVDAVLSVLKTDE